MPSLTLEALGATYQKLWDTTQINPKFAGKANEITSQIQANKARYEAVAAKTGCPWHFIAVTHNMESSLSFSKHLHNGDPLTGKTFQVPSGRPPGPPKNGSAYTWEESAEDILLHKKLNLIKDWSIPRLLYELEKYNGWGYRQYHPDVLTPYLWSGTNHYTSGKYVADGRFDRGAVSAQCGCVPLLKILTNGAPIVAPNKGLNCVDPGLAGSQTLTMQNPQTQADAFQIAIGLDQQYRSRTHEFKGRLNPASNPDVLDIDIQKTFAVKGFGEELDGDYNCEDVCFRLLDSGIEVEVNGFKGDPSMAAPQVFAHDSTQPLTGGQAPAADTADSAAAAIPAGSINQRIFQAAQASRGASSRSGPGGGNVACAWILNTVVFPKAGIKTIGSNPNLVASVEQALQGGRGQAVERSQAQPGDIAIMPNKHIGICMAAGCTSLLSNSSSKATFTWDAPIGSYDSYYRTTTKIYRVTS
jgi:lysozyme family protein